RVLVGLIGPQPGRRRAVEDRARDDVAAGARVDVAGDLVHQRLRHVLDDREAAGHVAVERGVSDRDLALVAGGEYEPAELVAQRHQQGAADAGLDVLLGDIFLEPLERRRQRLLEAREDGRDRQRLEVDAEIPGEALGVAAGPARRVRGRQRDPGDVLATERLPPRGRV